MTQQPLILAVETSGRLGSVAIAAGRQILAETGFSTPVRHSAELFPAICDLLARFSQEPKEIEQVYISVGPGSFTGLRIAVTLAKIMHLANNTTKIVAVDTLDVIAANVIELTTQTTSDERRATSDEKVAAILDAKRSQFFIAVYQQQSTAENAESTVLGTPYGEKELELNSANSAASTVKRWKKIFPDSLMTASQFLNKFAGKADPVWLLGEALVYYKDKFKAPGVKFLDEKYWTPKAAKVHSLGWQKAQVAKFADPLTLRPNYLRTPDVKGK